MNLFLIISTTCITTILIFYIFNCRLHIKKNTELSNALQKTTESNTTLQKQESIAATKAEERSRSLEQQSSTIIELREEIKKLTEDRASLKSELDAKETIIQTINSQHLQDMKNMREKLGAEFENLTTKLLKSNSKEFADVSREKIEQLILPLQEKIKIFENNIQYLQTTTSQERLTLTTNIKSIVESNSVLAKQTEDLKRALKGDIQKQGAWGELILETVLKSSGLRKGHEYTIHGEGLELKDTEGQRQHPDIIINLPDDRHLIIDSKSSYPHYEDYLTAENELEKSDSLKKLIISIQNHVKTLSEKKYHFSESLSTPNLTLMFIPIEAMFSLVIENQKNLFEEAWRKHIVIVSPANLLAILRTIESLWKIEKQNQNAQEIAKEGAFLYDKFVGLLSNLKHLNTSLEGAMKHYADALTKIEGKGGIATKIEKLKDLGLKTKKSIPREHLEGKEEDLKAITSDDRSNDANENGQSLPF